MFNLPLFKVIPHRSAYVMLGGALVWGLTTSLIYKYIDRKQFVTSNDNQKQRNQQHIFRVLPLPARKIHEEDEKKVRLKKPIKLK